MADLLMAIWIARMDTRTTVVCTTVHMFFLEGVLVLTGRLGQFLHPPPSHK